MNVRDEVPAGLTPVPVQKPQLEALAAAVKASGTENVYPERIGYTYVGDAPLGLPPINTHL